VRHRHLTRWARRAVAIAAAALAASTLSSAPAQAATSTFTSCGLRTTSKTLALLGDTADYYLASGGGFEFGQMPWFLTKATRVAGNEPWNVVPGARASSLRISPGGTAASGYDCNATGEDSIRFFYRSPGVPGATLHVTVASLSFGVAPKTYDIPGTTSGWALSDSLPVPNQRGMLGAQFIAFSFTATGTPASWQIDDVLVDPWRAL
jgi:hypothetical protein